MLNNQLEVWYDEKSEESKKQFEDFYFSSIGEKEHGNLFSKKNKYIDEEYGFSLSIHVPEPRIYDDFILINWRENNWGTRHDAEYNSLTYNGYKIDIIMNTYKGSVFEWFEKVVKIYPELEFHYMLEYEDGGGSYYYNVNEKIKKGNYRDYKRDL